MIAFAEQNHKPMDSVQYLVQDLSQSWDSLSPVLKALESKLETKSEEKQLDEIRQACSDNGMQVTKLNVDLYANYLNKFNMNPDLNAPSNFGPAFHVEDKTSPAFAFMKNIMFDIALRPDATALNPHAYDQLAAKWDPNGPIVPIYVHGIHLMSYKL
ncbi:unnamed protein product [Medioppia subpectinata]|uniref:Uncharacterized protein n=1 Tax=Medioppia subpectinata TaxID=1979941 RepID=A0A7R9KXH9_9ACAR|nr:unnamed protein product [Medioppia subpectinata]CAG2110551.1 unnamed protein product [Medioppia subpectinata]